jgi:hypothetical protein
MTHWPDTIPEDLRTILDGTLTARNVNSAQVWGDVVDWLRKHGVEAPAQLPEWRAPERSGEG